MTGNKVTEYRFTPLVKSLSAFIWYIKDDGPTGRLVSDEFRVGMGKELKLLHIRVQILYLITAVLAFILIGGGVQRGASILIFGNTIPVSMLSGPMLAVINAGLFGYYCTNYMSYIVLIGMLRQLNEKETRSHWAFYVADIASDVLWATPLRGNDHLFKESKMGHWLSKITLYTGLSTVILHVLVIICSCGVTAGAAWGVSWWGFCISAFSAIITSSSALALAIAVALPLRYSVRA
ncbi:MAG: hypothetical protein JWM33_458 [Caulobacteraceae bacterium]|nr:hypothetical protein [Caulobacteraceae bacterium]